MTRYTSHADLGGQSGHGPVQPEAEHIRFHADWEPRALALTLAMGATGAWTIDESRAARETLPGYAQLSYYQIWLAGLQRLMTDRGLVTEDELAHGRAIDPPRPLPRKLMAADVPAVLARGSRCDRPVDAPARFAPGDVVRTRAGAVDHHQRVPAYAQGRTGRIERWHGAHVFAEASAQGFGQQPQHLYTVVFDAPELWGAEAAPGTSVSIDAWESTLQPVSPEAR